MTDNGHSNGSNDGSYATCGATNKKGKPCHKPAGWGTAHPGTGTCKLHGGSTQAAALSAAKQAAVVMGLPIDIPPHEALLQCIRITAGEVAYCNMRIKELNDEDATGHPIEIVERVGGEDGGYTETREKTPMMNIWIRARQASIERLAKYAKMALDANVDERRVQVAEGMAQLMAPILKRIFDQLELSPKQKRKAPKILEANLLELEGDTALIQDAEVVP